MHVSWVGNCKPSKTHHRMNRIFRNIVLGPDIDFLWDGFKEFLVGIKYGRKRGDLPASYLKEFEYGFRYVRAPPPERSVVLEDLLKYIANYRSEIVWTYLPQLRYLVDRYCGEISGSIF
jgi:hypothetical protein